MATMNRKCIPQFKVKAVQCVVKTIGQLAKIAR